MTSLLGGYHIVERLGNDTTKTRWKPIDLRARVNVVDRHGKTTESCVLYAIDTIRRPEDALDGVVS
jgi:hypothetical protein